jgi:hypothetical protein
MLRLNQSMSKIELAEDTHHKSGRLSTLKT